MSQKAVEIIEKFTAADTREAKKRQETLADFLNTAESVLRTPSADKERREKFQQSVELMLQITAQLADAEMKFQEAVKKAGFPIKLRYKINWEEGKWVVKEVEKRK